MVNKELIYRATLKLAAEKGLGAVSLSQIAQEVGIQKASLYSHFASKDEIIQGLYGYLREQAKEHMYIGAVDYGELVKGKEAAEILSYVVNGYKKMNEDPEMEKFYRFIAAESASNREAAKIMVQESEKMILATKQLFYAMEVQHIMTFKNVDMAAFSFAMGARAILMLEQQKEMAGIEENGDMMNRYLKDFCCIYGGC